MSKDRVLIGKTVTMRIRGVSAAGKQVTGLAPKLEKSFNSIGITLKKNNNTFKSTYEIMNELAKKWSTLSDFQKSNITQLVAGKRQGNIILSALNNWKVATRTLNQAMNSSGSAEKRLGSYMDSIQAKINKYKNAQLQFWHDILNTSAIKDFVSAGAGIYSMLDKLHKSFGLLPPAIGAATAALLLFNDNMKTAVMENGMLMMKSLKGIVNGFRGLDEAFAASTLKARLFGITSKTLSVSIKGIGIALKSVGEFALGSILPVAAITAATYGIEKLINHYQKLHQQQVQFKQESDKMVSAYSKNQDQINQKIKEYNALSAKKQANGLSSSESKKYLQVQNQINAMMPSLTDHVDKNGQAHLQTAKNIQTEIKYVKELKANQEQLSAVTYQKDVQKYADSLQKLKNQLNFSKGQANSNQGKAYYQGDGLYFHAPKSQEQQVKDQQQVIFQEHELQLAMQKSSQLAKQKVDAFLSVDHANKKLTNSDQKLIQSMIDQGTEQLKNAKNVKQYDNIMKDVIGKATAYGDALSKLRDVLGKNANLDFTKNLSANQMNSLAMLFENVKKGNTPISKFNQFLKHIGLNGKQTAAVLNLLSNGFDKNNKSASAASKAIAAFNKTIKSTSSTSAFINKSLYGFNSQDVTNLKDALAIYQALSHVQNKNATETTYYNQALKVLEKTFPSLVDGHKANIKAIDVEIQQQEILLKATKDSASGQLNAAQQLTLGMAQEAVKRKKIIHQEITMLETKMLALISSNRNEMNGAAAQKWNQIENLKRQLNNIYIPEATDAINNLGKAINYTGDASKSASSKLKNQVYITNKLQDALNRLNNEYTRLKNIQSEYPQWSQTYQDQLKKEIHLLYEKEKILTQQKNSLQSQIRSGNITQYGLVSTSSASSSNSYSGGGGYSGKYASYINKASSRYGVPAALIAAVVRAESGFNASARSYAGAQGLMQLMPATARGLGVSNPYNAYQNIMGGTKYLAGLLREFNGNIRLALAGYNAGAGNVRKYGGIPPFAQTQHYVPEVMGYYHQYSNSSGGSVSVASARSHGSSKAQRQQAIDQAKQQIGSIQSNLSNINQQILQLQMQMVQSHVAYYDKLVNDQNVAISHLKEEQTLLDQNRATWRSREQDIVNHYRKQLVYQEQEVGYLKKQIKYNHHLTQAAKDQLNQTLQNKEKSIDSLRTTIINAEKSISSSKLTELTSNMSIDLNTYQTKIKNIQDQLTLNNIKSGSTDSLSNLKEQLKYLTGQKQLAERAVSSLKDMQKHLKQFPSLMQKDQQAIQQWEQTIESTSVSISQAQAQIKAVYTNVSNDIVNVYKSAYKNMEQIALDANQKQLDSLKKVHDTRIQYLNDQLNTITNNASQQQYQQQLSQKQQARQQTLDQINRLSLDKTLSAQKQVHDLKAQLAQQTQAIATFEHQHQITLRKKNIQDQIKSENTKYQNQQTSLQNQRKQIQSYWTNLINNDRHWTKIQNDVLNKHFSAISADLKSFTDTMKKNMADLGTSISNNLIDQIAKAQKELNALNGKAINVAASPSLLKIPNINSNNQTNNISKEPLMKLLSNSGMSLLQNFVKASVPQLSNLSNNAQNNNLQIDVHIGSVNGSQQDVNNFFTKITDQLHQKGVNLNWG